MFVCVLDKKATLTEGLKSAFIPYLAIRSFFFETKIFIRIRWQSEREEEEMRAAGIPAPEMRGLHPLQTDTELPAEV